MSEHGVKDFGGSSAGTDDLTENERAWVDFLRLVSNGRDPALRLRDVQLMRRLMLRSYRGRHWIDVPAVHPTS